MNYLELINAILLELNYEEVSNFSDLTKIEHKKIKNLVNRLNNEICLPNNDFYFRQFVKNLKIYPEKKEYKIPFSGKINKIIGKLGEYKFDSDYSKFYLNNADAQTYSVYGEKILFSETSDYIKVFYSTNYFVIEKNETLKSEFEFETDKSIIPDIFVKKLLIHGVSYMFKQDASHPKYAHWKNEYNNALKTLLAEAKENSCSESIINGGFRKL